MKNIQTLKGFRDFLPLEALKRQYVIDKLKKEFELYGFEPLETPSLEYEEILSGKYGQEGEKLMYRFEDLGKRKVAMRYDQTVPLARLIALYRNKLYFPFKRYQIQNVWRAENTQKGRYREFIQCDIDIVGSTSLLADAEVVELSIKALQVLGFKKFKILVNDRKVFTSLLLNKDLSKDELSTFVRIIDKIKKIGKDGVLEELSKYGFKRETANILLTKIQNQEKTDTLKDIYAILENSSIAKGQLVFEPTLARGLDYYTGLIFEIETEEYEAGSLGGGGRYDNLVGMFANEQIPAVGFAFGFDRIIEAMDYLQLFPTNLKTSKVLVTIFSNELKDNALEVVAKLRENLINSELFLSSQSVIDKQLKYANQKSIPYVVIIGPEEASQKLLTLKDMSSGQQEKLTLPELIKKVKNL